MSAFKFENTANDVAAALSEHIKGKNVVITGASPGSLAFEAAKSIAGRKPGLLVLTARSEALLQQTRDAILTETADINIKLVAYDLSKQETIRKAVSQVKALNVKFDVLINSAGVMAPPYALTEEGIESQFGINHIGPFFFTNLLIPQLNESATIVNVTSRGYQLGNIQWDDLSFKATPYNKWHAYAQSKAANILFSNALARVLADRHITSYSVHPGTIFTNLARHLTQEDYDMLAGIPMEYKTAQQGAANMVIAAFDPSIKDRSGAHIDDDNQIKPIPEQFGYSTGVENEERLWALSEELVKEKFVY
ncbi:hypothetical protein ASPCAL04779 [Aspergillus calidoustus]|uniref:Short-chain dehydrogenase n=1 Tax=Aspergillus calidoustus TaxID=454130 RepID=A0A0U5FVX0_ASPCI|nr:hypothetical protein ASPCAL04779 [Aspergillus calidoustus]